MNTCNCCGTSLKLLFNLWYCPNDCDKKNNQGWIEYKSSGWLYKELNSGDIIPKDATRGWWTTFSSIENAFSSISSNPGWSILYSSMVITLDVDVEGRGLIIPSNRKLAIFKKK